MRASHPFARIAHLVRNSVRGQDRPRPKRQFRIDALEGFEERITPTVTLVPGPYFPSGPPFVPPGMGSSIAPAPISVSQTWSASGNTISVTVTNPDTTSHYVTFAYYTAPGGGGNTSGNAYDNLASQKLVGSQTVLLGPAGSATDTYTFSVDASTLKLSGQDKIQCDLFDADGFGLSGYAPDKPTIDNVNNYLLGGALFSYEPDTGNGEGPANGNN